MVRFAALVLRGATSAGRLGGRDATSSGGNPAFRAIPLMARYADAVFKISSSRASFKTPCANAGTLLIGISSI